MPLYTRPCLQVDWMTDGESSLTLLCSPLRCIAVRLRCVALRCSHKSTSAYNRRGVLGRPNVTPHPPAAAAVLSSPWIILLTILVRSPGKYSSLPACIPFMNNNCTRAFRLVRMLIMSSYAKIVGQGSNDTPCRHESINKNLTMREERGREIREWDKNSLEEYRSMLRGSFSRVN